MARGTIKSSREIDELFRSGRRISTPVALLLVRPSADPVAGGRVAYIAGKRLGSAVARNRAKRRLREAVRAAGGPWSGVDVAIVASAPTLSASAEELEAVLRGTVPRAVTL